MKKHIGIITGILIAALTLAACGKTPEIQNETKTETAPVTADTAASTTAYATDDGNPYWCGIEITEPSDNNALMPPNREFYVNGKFHSNGTIPEGAIFAVYISDTDDKLIEYVAQNIKDNKNYLIDSETAERNGVTKEELLKIAGATHMPELLYDGTNPESFNDTTLKCWFDDNNFKAVMQGLPEGNYYILAELVNAEKHIIAQASDRLEIKLPDDSLLARFHPDSHAANMYEWCYKNHYAINYDYIPGFFPGVNGNSGAKTVNFIKSDCALYDGSHTRMFVYMIDPESSSYTIELPFLFSRGYVDDPKKFTAYRYDTGEAELSSEFGKVKGTIVKFTKADHHAICRVDTVNEKAKENEFDLQNPCYDTFDTIPDDGAEITYGSKFAIMGVLSPQTLDDNLTHDEKTDLYSVNNRVESIRYTISKDENVFEIEKPVFLKRSGVDEKDENYGSVYEYYHIFDTSEYGYGSWTFASQGLDKNGKEVGGTEEILFITIGEEPSAEPVNVYITSKDFDSLGNIKLPFKEDTLLAKGYKPGDMLTVNIDGKNYDIPFVHTFTDIPENKPACYMDGKENNCMVIGYSNTPAAEEMSLAKSDEIDGEDVWLLLDCKEKIQIAITLTRPAEDGSPDKR